MVAAEWGVTCGSETARAIRKRSSMGAEGADYFSLYFHNELKFLRRHPAEQLHGPDNCSIIMVKYLYSMLYPERHIHAWNSMEFLKDVFRYLSYGSLLY